MLGTSLMVALAILCIHSQPSLGENELLAKDLNQAVLQKISNEKLEAEEQDTDKVTQALQSLLMEAQEYGDIQDFDDEDLSTLAEMQDEGVEQAIMNAAYAGSNGEFEEDMKAFINALTDIEEKDTIVETQDNGKTNAREQTKWQDLIKTLAEAKVENDVEQNQHKFERSEREANIQDAIENEAETQDTDEDTLAALNEVLPSRLAAANQHDEDTVGEVLDSMANIQWRRRRRRWRPRRPRIRVRPKRVLRRVVRRVTRVARRIKRVVRKAIKKIPIKRITRKLSKAIKKGLKKLKSKTGVLKNIFSKAGNLLKKIIKFPKKFGSKAFKTLLGMLKKGEGSLGDNGGGSNEGGGSKGGTGSSGSKPCKGCVGGAGSLLTRLTKGDANSFLKKMIVIIKNYGQKKRG